jgi:hypothetical protein
MNSLGQSNHSNGGELANGEHDAERIGAEDLEGRLGADGVAVEAAVEVGRQDSY